MPNFGARDTHVRGAQQLFLPIHDPAGRPVPVEEITACLRALPGIRYAYVSAQTEMAWLICDPACFDLAQAQQALGALGYQAGPPERSGIVVRREGGIDDDAERP